MATLTHITDKKVAGNSLPGKVITVSEVIDFWLKEQDRAMLSKLLILKQGKLF